MNISEQDLYLIEKKHQGDLSADEEQLYANKLKQDTNFALFEKEFIQLKQGIRSSKLKAITKRLQTLESKQPTTAAIDSEPEDDDQIKAGIRYAKKKALMGRLQELEKRPNRVVPIKNRSYMLPLAIAASILLIGVLTWQWIYTPTTSKTSNYFAHLNRDSANLSDGKTAGERAYDQQEYAKAWPLLVEEIKAPNDSLNMLYAGVAALGAGQPEKAITLLENHCGFRGVDLLSFNHSMVFGPWIFRK